MSTISPAIGGPSPSHDPSGSVDAFLAARVATELIAQGLRDRDAVPSWPTGPLRVGVDLVGVGEIVDSVERFGERYLHRIFTPHEIDCCRTTDGAPGALDEYSYESLAARFAAKEAVIKVLHPEGPRPEWRSIEVHRADGGWCELRLSGLAATLAGRAGIDHLAVSLTHESSMGAAVVVATCSDHPHLVHHPNGGEPSSPDTPPTTREER